MDLRYVEGLSTEARSVYCNKIIPKSVGISRVVEFVGSAMIVEGIKVVGIVRVIEGIKFLMPRDPASFIFATTFGIVRTGI